MTQYVEVPGTEMFELPPLLIHQESDEDVSPSSLLIGAEEMMPAIDAPQQVLEVRKFELALLLVESYKLLLANWLLGDSVLEWIRQCEITFESEASLRNILRPNIWPRAGDASFVELIRQKEHFVSGGSLEKAVGLRLTFRQPPPADCFSAEFLTVLNSAVALSAYKTWAQLIPPGPALLPPDRFHFDVLSLGY